MSVLSNVCDKLKCLRVENKLSQVELSEILNINQTSICMFEKAKREPNTWQLKKYAEYFNISIDWLFGLSNKKERD